MKDGRVMKKVAIVGFGFMGKTHYGAWKKCRGAKVVAICDSNLAQLTAKVVGNIRGAADGEGTRHFFLICSTNHEEHLHILARLAILAHGTDLMERLDAVETPEDAIAAIRDCEAEYRK